MLLDKPSDSLVDISTVPVCLCGQDPKTHLLNYLLCSIKLQEKRRLPNPEHTGHALGGKNILDFSIMFLVWRNSFNARNYYIQVCVQRLIFQPNELSTFLPLFNYTHIRNSFRASSYLERKDRGWRRIWSLQLWMFIITFLMLKCQV